jgi:xylulokinase
MLAVGVDVGSTNTKVALVAVDPPRVLRVLSRPTPRDAGDLTGLVCRLVGEVVAGAPVRPAVVGVASMAETGVPLDRDGVALCELLRWDAGRGGEDAAALAAEYGAGPLFAATGVRVSGKVPMATWRWLRRTRPAVWAAMARWAGAADLVGLALTGRLATDHTLAGRTMAYRLPLPGAALPAAFDTDLLAAVGLRPEQLPTVGGPAGTVAASAAATTGLAAGTPVVIAGHDHQVGAWAAGAREPGAVADSLGTAESLIRVLGEPPDRAAVAAQGMSLVRTAGGRYDALVAGSPSAGALLANRTASLPAAAALPPHPTGYLVLPYPSGRQSPAPDPTARLRILPAPPVATDTALPNPPLPNPAPPDAMPPEVAVPDPPGAAGAVVPDSPGVPKAVLPNPALPEAVPPNAMVPGAVVPTEVVVPEAVPDPPGAAEAVLSGAVPAEVVPAEAVVTRAVVEGVALQGRWMYEVQCELAGAAGSAVVVLGGAGGSGLWVRVKAAVLPVPVRWVAVGEPVAAGAALLAAARAGLAGADPPPLPATAVGAPDPAYDAVFESFVATARRPAAGRRTRRAGG